MTRAEEHGADDRLRALFALDEPAPRDPVFSTEVMSKVMRRRFQEDMAFLCAATLAGGAALWAIWPVLQPVLVTLSQGFAPALGVLGVAACALVVVGGRVRTALGLAS